jgi:hypothetical protein
MKIKSLFLVIALALFSSAALAQEGMGLEIKSKSSAKKAAPKEEIKTFDFQKIFAEAEKYYKEAQAWQTIACKPKSGFICTKHECVKRPIKAVVTLDKKAKTITRCEDDICESFPATFNQTGVFVNVQTEGPVGTLIRVLGDYRYKEITTVGLDAYIANGECLVVSNNEKEEAKK